MTTAIVVVRQVAEVAEQRLVAAQRAAQDLAAMERAVQGSTQPAADGSRLLRRAPREDRVLDALRRMGFRHQMPRSA